MADLPLNTALHSDSKDVPKDAATRSKRRLELRQLNLAAWDRQGPQEGLGKLDTSLKRHTALLTRLRSSLHAKESVPGILKDISSLSLEKYVEEAVGATVEGLAKCKTGPETQGAVEIISALHQRFPELFTAPFTSALLLQLKPSSSNSTDKDIKEKEDNARIIRQRGLLRTLAELELAGVVKKPQIGEVTWTVLKDLLTADKEDVVLVAPLGIAFAKHLGPLLLPSTAHSQDGEDQDFPALPGESEEASDASLVPREIKDKFRKLLVAYLEALGRRETKAHLELQKTDKRNHEAYIRSGEVFEDREKRYEKSVREWERGWASVTQLSEILGVPVPPLQSLSSNTVGTVVTAGTSSFATGEEFGGPGSLWIDEEDKSFYEDLRDLRGEIPLQFLGGSAPGVSKEEQVGNKMDVDSNETDTNAEPLPEAQHEPAQAEAAREVQDNPIAALLEETPDPGISAGPAAQLSALFARLTEASSRSSIDTIAVEFAFLNSKAARKRLVKALGSVHRNRPDILPYYGRLVGTLNPYMPDIGKELVAVLEDEFRYLQKRRNADLAETRSKNLRFLSELTKFRVTPNHAILHIFKVLLDDFSGPNVDNLCTLMEGCGRFLLRSEATSDKMRAMLEILKRKKAATNLDQRQITMLDNAYYQCDPPDRSAIQPKERTPMQMYIRHLFYNVLTRNSSDRVLKLVRKLHWEDQGILAKLHSVFTKVWKIKYSNVHLFAVLLYDLGRYHPDFSVSVIDEILENIRAGMEINNFKYNQQRVATVKYLGELYNYRVLDSRVIFDTLWSLVTFGHPDGRPYPDVVSRIDPPDDAFRVRLICTLLDTCGSCFERGTLRKKLDSFLTFFQLYTLSKSTLPMDVEFMLSDTFEQLRPKLVKFQNFAEAAQAVDEMMAAVSKSGPIEEDADEAVEEERRVAVASEDESSSGGSSSEDDSADDDEDDGAVAESDEDEELAERRRDPNAMTQDEEDEFNRELAKMLAGAGESRKPTERKGGLADVGVPMLRRQKQAEEEEIAEGADGQATAPRGMKFTLLTKKGAKQQTHAMEIPLESAIAVHSLEKRAQDKAEQQQLKRLVLDYEQREEQAEKQALKDTLARRGINLTYRATPFKVEP